MTPKKKKAMDGEDEEVEEECLSLLGWSVEQVARSSLPEMYEALHQHRSRKTFPSSPSNSSSSSRCPSVTRVPTTPDFPIPSVVHRIHCLRQRVEMQERVLQLGHCGGVDDVGKMTRNLESDRLLLEEDRFVLKKRLETLERLLTQKSQTLHVLDNLLAMTDQVQGLSICLSHDTQHKKEVVEDVRILQVEQKLLLNSQ
jgi:hypothetical protein